MQALLDCQLCPRLCQSRLVVVNGSGPVPAQILIVAQAPGRSEEQADPPQPLVGWSGQRLREKLMPLAGIDPNAVRYENIVRCRPPAKKGGDMPPTAAEVANCRQFLSAAIAAVQPTVIITLGAPALRWFLPTAKLEQCHGQPQSVDFLDNVIVVPVHHPAAAAPGRNPKLVPVMYDDWRKLGQLLAGRRPRGLGDYQLVSGYFINRFLTELYDVRGSDMVFAFDLETTDPMWKDTFQAHHARPIGFSVSVREAEAFYTTDSPECIRPWLESTQITKVCHNAKFETTVLAEIQIKLRNVHDTKLMAAVLRKPSTHLKQLSWSELGLRQTRFEAVDWEDLAAVVQYGAADSDMTLRLYHTLYYELYTAGLWQLYNDIERPVVQVLSDIERYGVAVDSERLLALAAELQADRLGTTDWLSVIYPYPVNWASHSQKAAALFGPPVWGTVVDRELKGRLLKVDREEGVRTGAQVVLRWVPPGLGLPVGGRTDSGEPSVDMQYLLALLPNPVVEAVVRLASVEQTLGQVMKLADLIQEDGRIHASFHQAGGNEAQANVGGEAPDSRRFSSSGPNLQQVVHHGDTARPYVAEWGRRAHSAFVAPAGSVLFKADFGQQEPRIAAAVSGDKELLYDLEHGDVYCRVASRVYGRVISRADVEERQTGKRNFMAWLNGSEGDQFRDAAPWLSRAEAGRIAQWIGEQYPVFQAFRLRTVQFLKDHGYVETAFGGRRYLPGIYSSADSDRLAAGREAIIVPIQGTAADVLKLCLGRLASHEFFQKRWMRIVLLVHDEVAGEVHPPLLEADGWPTAAVNSLLTDMAAGLLAVRLPVEVGYGPDWANCLPLEKRRTG